MPDLPKLALSVVIACALTWLLQSSSGGCAVPQEAQGYQVLLERLPALLNFDHENFICAQGSTENNGFQMWKREAVVMNAKTV